MTSRFRPLSQHERTICGGAALRLYGYVISLEAFSRLDFMAGDYSNDDYLRSLLDLPLFGKRVGGMRKLTPHGKPKEAKRFRYDA